MPAPRRSVLRASRVAVVAVGVLLPLAARAQRVPAALAPDDERAVRAVATALDARWNARDAEGLARLFAPDADVAIRGDALTRMQGPAVRDGYRAMLAQAAPALRHRSAVDALHVVAPGVVVADGRAW